MKKNIVVIITSIVGLVGLVGVPVYALGINDAVGNLQDATKDSGLKANLSDTIGSVVKGALALVGTIFLVLTIYAGILWMTAQGKEEQVESSQKIIKATIIGLFITMSAYAITYFVTNRLTGQQAVNPNTCTAQGGTCKKDCGNGVAVPDAVCAGNQLCCK